VLVQAITAEELKKFTLDNVSAFLFAQVIPASLDTICASVARLVARKLGSGRPSSTMPRPLPRSWR
jgi:hypothetical protein